jgi:hypothetical protein
MDGVNSNVVVADIPDQLDVLEAQLRGTLDDIIRWLRNETGRLSLWQLEKALWLWIALVYRLCVAMFLAARHRQLDLSEYVAQGWRIKKGFAERNLKTMAGPVRYGRAYLTRRSGSGWFPLDAKLGITQDGFSWRVIDLVTRLATRVSYQATRNIVTNLLGWSPSAEAIEKLAIGLGQRAEAFMATQGRLADDGEVLVIEVDGKAAPFATETEMAARRAKRKGVRCGCGYRNCKRHQRRAKRRGKPRKRKKRGHNSKNGRSATLVAMYTLKRDDAGRLHGPINKKLWGRFGSRRGAIAWARGQATRRGFGPKTKRVIQIVVDGDPCLRQQLEKLFPKAIFTLDLRHAEERLWKAGRPFHAEDSVELREWVAPLQTLLVAGRIDALLKRLRTLRSAVASRGPNTRAKREILTEQIRYFEERKDMMCYGEYRRQDLVLATGVIEGACRHVIGERLDCAGMRWTLAGAEPLMQLRCIELNGDWDAFMRWWIVQTKAKQRRRNLVQIRRPTNKHDPTTCQNQAA